MVRVTNSRDRGNLTRDLPQQFQIILRDAGPLGVNQVGMELAQARVKVREQISHLGVVKSAYKSWHHALAFKHN